MKVAEGKLVKVAYDLFLDGYNEELAYSTKNEEDGSGCIEFVCGKGELLEPMEAKLVGMEPGHGIIMNAVVNEITDDHVILDFNPIYAGEDLYFIGKVVDVRNAK